MESTFSGAPKRPDCFRELLEGLKYFQVLLVTLFFSQLIEIVLVEKSVLSDQICLLPRESETLPYSCF